MRSRTLRPENTVFVLLCFEGPDSYSLAGGLGVRASRLSEALARQGYETHLFFIGDPGLEGLSTSGGGRLLMHRWCQWISRYHPSGVYDGEEGKLNDFTASLPGYVVEVIARPAMAKGKQLVGMTGEDYAHDFEDAVVLETSKAEEMVASMLYLHENKNFENRLRDRARSTARDFTWDRIIEHRLMPKLERLNWERCVH